MYGSVSNVYAQRSGIDMPCFLRRLLWPIALEISPDFRCVSCHVSFSHLLAFPASSVSLFSCSTLLCLVACHTWFACFIPRLQTMYPMFHSLSDSICPLSFAHTLAHQHTRTLTLTLIHLSTRTPAALSTPRWRPRPRRRTRSTTSWTLTFRGATSTTRCWPPPTCTLPFDACSRRGSPRVRRCGAFSAWSDGRMIGWQS
jgi:hypothetical protein